MLAFPFSRIRRYRQATTPLDRPLQTGIVQSTPEEFHRLVHSGCLTRLHISTALIFLDYRTDMISMNAPLLLNEFTLI